MPPSFGTDSDIVSQPYIATLKVYLGKIIEFRWTLIERRSDEEGSFIRPFSKRARHIRQHHV